MTRRNAATLILLMMALAGLVLLLLATGCDSGPANGGGGDGGGGDPNAGLVGTWEPYSVGASGATMVFRADGSGDAINADGSHPFSWERALDKVAITWQVTGKTDQYALAGQLLSNGSGSLVFRKA